jgi:hypothetical protein
MMALPAATVTVIVARFSPLGPDEYSPGKASHMTLLYLTFRTLPRSYHPPLYAS